MTRALNTMIIQCVPFSRFALKMRFASQWQGRGKVRVFLIITIALEKHCVCMNYYTIM